MDNNELSERELEILRLIATGASNKEVAQELCISTNTVKVHLKNIFSKVGVASRTEAALYAIRLGLAPDGLVENKSGEIIVSGDGDRSLDYGATRLPVETDLSSIELPGRLWPGSYRSRRLGWIVVGAFFFVILIGAGVFWFRQSALSTTVTQPPAPTPTSRWQELAPLAIPRKGLAAAAFNTKIYAIAGETTQGVTGAVEQYDPQGNYWISRSSKPVPVADISAAVIGGLIYVPGGRLASGQVTNALEVYDPSLDSWIKKAALPEAISAYAMAAFEGRLYLFGGWDGKKYVSSVYVYDPSRDQWIAEASMPTARGFAGAADAGGHIFVFGGLNETGALAVSEEYYPERQGSAENPWSAATPLPEARYAMGVVSMADIIHVVEGAGKSKDALPTLEYLASTKQWQRIDQPVTQSWSHLAIVPLDTRLYILGGQISSAPTARSFAYQAIYTIMFPIVQ